MVGIPIFPRPLALTRLKSNLFLLLLSLLARSIFTPYRTIRRGVIWIVEDKAGWTFVGRAYDFLEWGVVLLFAFNAAQAAWSLHVAPSTAPTQTALVGRTFTPSKPSSPLASCTAMNVPPDNQTRAYAPSPERATASPLSLGASTSQARYSLTNRYSTPTKQLQSSTPTRAALGRSGTPGSIHRSSPLSASTAKILNIPRPTTPSQTGLFFDDSTGAAAPGAGAPAASVGSGAAERNFVMVDRDEREWVDNVWKGVRGKGGRLGL